MRRPLVINVWTEGGTYSNPLTSTMLMENELLTRDGACDVQMSEAGENLFVMMSGLQESRAVMPRFWHQV